MLVKFYEGWQARRAFRANTDTLCAVAVRRAVPDRVIIEVDRWHANLEMTDAVMDAVMTRWKQELPLLKDRAEGMWATGADTGECHFHTEFSVTIGKEMLAGWKTFLADLLSRPESWGSHHEDKRRLREQRRILASLDASAPVQ
jgi:hypothetical protein